MFSDESRTYLKTNIVQINNPALALQASVVTFLFKHSYSFLFFLRVKAWVYCQVKLPNITGTHKSNKRHEQTYMLRIPTTT